MVPESTCKMEEAQEDNQRFPGAGHFAANTRLCSFHANDTRWAAAGMPGVSQLQIPPGLGRQQAMAQSLSQCSLGAGPPPNSMGLSSSLSRICINPHFQGWCPLPFRVQRISPDSDVWRGTSIASLRRKALEHTVSMSFT
ncbi:hypothetical protein M9458_011127 [Cirrhinus mrigala]|uniref:OAR domain-containing protein n=1 Tax=Cirrhinus mrigala TaxID=683832 RepID=A0ABD0R344_CIRMR